MASVGRGLWKLLRYGGCGQGLPGGVRSGCQQRLSRRAYHKPAPARRTLSTPVRKGSMFLLLYSENRVTCPTSHSSSGARFEAPGSWPSDSLVMGTGWAQATDQSHRGCHRPAGGVGRTPGENGLLYQNLVLQAFVRCLGPPRGCGGRRSCRCCQEACLGAQVS